jgi:hypothetical protein
MQNVRHVQHGAVQPPFLNPRQSRLEQPALLSKASTGACRSVSLPQALPQYRHQGSIDQAWHSIKQLQLRQHLG